MKFTLIEIFGSTINKAKQIVYFIALALSLAACGNQQQTEKTSTANETITSDITLYSNGNIITLDESNPIAEAVAVKEGTIIAVGSMKEVISKVGENARQIDLMGNTMTPGFIDAHGHISFTALNLASANLSSPPVGPVKNVEDAVAQLIEHRDTVAQDGWITAYGYDDSLVEEKRHLTREDLDRVSTEQVVLVRHVSGHFMSCNTVCLELAGIDADTPDPDGGVIRRMVDSNEPNGVLEETAMTALYTIYPQPDKAAKLKMLESAQKYYASYGVTTVQDGAASLEEVDLLREAAANQALLVDIVSFPYAVYAGERLKDYPPSKSYDNGFRVGGFKLVLDGSPQGKTAWLTQPYLHPPHGQEQGYKGYATLKDEQVAEFVDYAFSNNIPFNAHANGDAAADQLINAVTAGNEKYGNADRRTVMIHAQTVREDQIDAMLEQNIIPSFFSAHTFYWGDWHRDSVFGVERASRISPLRSSADKGLLYTTHNDTPIVPTDMMRLMWASVNRITRSGVVLGEEQRATPLEALKSITINAAYSYFEEESKGSITAGKVADFVILDANPLEVDRKRIKDIKILKTIKAGEVIFASEGA